ncbi:ribonuclease H-like protein [Rickenella mellea]|uniref:Ribonuclease H-like protein n=1 Tax=Rickenella mellea TaxID=50990 RepID=A0A4Y7QNH2_9AGAM|nr:ribonuclease H-like protein [Rickenella mellea]
MSSQARQLLPYSWRKNSTTGSLIYLRDHELANHELSTLNARIVGFDLEWKPKFYKGGVENPVAVVQLATDDKILLIQVSAMKIEFPEQLVALLRDKDIIKAGVNIAGDLRKLYNDYHVSARSCVELSYMARWVDPQWTGQYSNLIGLARLVQAYEQCTLPKGRVQLSNWEALLNDIQQEYAANDAHAGLKVYRKLQTLALLMEDMPRDSLYTFDVICGRPEHPTGSCWKPEDPRPAVDDIEDNSANCNVTDTNTPTPTEGELDLSRSSMVIKEDVDGGDETENGAEATLPAKLKRKRLRSKKICQEPSFVSDSVDIANNG